MVKGVATILVILVAGTVLMYTLLIAGVLPVYAVKYRLDKEMIFEYKYSKAQHTLLTLFSITYDTSLGEKKVFESIAERYSINKPSNLDFLKSNLDELIEGKCYQIKVSDNILLDKKKFLITCEPEYWINSTLVLPYDPNKPLTQEIEVGIG